MTTVTFQACALRVNKRNTSTDGSSVLIFLVAKQQSETLFINHTNDVVKGLHRTKKGGLDALLDLQLEVARKMVPITGRASTFLEIFESSNLNPN